MSLFTLRATNKSRIEGDAGVVTREASVEADFPTGHTAMVALPEFLACFRDHLLKVESGYDESVGRTIPESK